MTSYKVTENKSTKAITFATEQQDKILGHHLHWIFHSSMKKASYSKPSLSVKSLITLTQLQETKPNPRFPSPMHTGMFGTRLLRPTKPSRISQLWGGEGWRKRQGQNKQKPPTSYMYFPALLDPNFSLYCSETTAKKTLLEELKSLRRTTTEQV